jgi:hypothetical protein
LASAGGDGVRQLQWGAQFQLFRPPTLVASGFISTANYNFTGASAFVENLMGRSQIVQSSKSDAKPSYTPKPNEVEALKAYKAAAAKAGPRLKIDLRGNNSVKIGADHPDDTIGTVALMRAVGTTDFDFYNGLMGQLVNASKETGVSESGTMLSVVKGIDPRR